MKTRLLRSLIFCLLLIGAVNSRAQIIATANNNGITPAGTIYGGQKIVAAGVSLTSATGTALTSIQFTCTQNIANYFTVQNIPSTQNGYYPTKIFTSLIRMNGAGTAYNAATGTNIATEGTTIQIGGGGKTLLTLNNFPVVDTIPPTGYSYFLVMTFNWGGPDAVPVNVSLKFSLTKINGAALTGYPATGILYNTLTWAKPAIITAKGNNVPEDNGIQVNDIYFSEQKIGVYGFSITVKNSRALITQVTVNTKLTQAPVGGFFQPTDVHLAENPGTDFRVGNVDIPTFNNPSHADGVLDGVNTKLTFYLKTPLDMNPVGAPGDSVTKNFFVYVNFNSEFKTFKNAVTFSLDAHGVGYTELPGGVSIYYQIYGSPNNGVTHQTQAQQVVNAPQTPIDGYEIGFATPTVAFTGQNVVGTGPGGNGISRTTQTFIPGGTKNIVLYGFSLTNTGSQTSVYDLSLALTAISPAPFSNFRLYRSTFSQYNTDSVTLVNSTIVGTSNLTITPTVSEPMILNETKYYFLVADWLQTVSTQSVQVTFKKITFTSNGTTPAIPTISNTDGQWFSLGVPEYDWEGNVSNDWNDKNNWYKNNALGAGAPGSSIASKDIVRIGIKKNVKRDIKLDKTRAIGYFLIGKLGSAAATQAVPSPVKVDLAGFNLTINNGIIVDTLSTLTLNNSVNIKDTIKVASTSTVASTGTIGFDPNTKPITIAKGSGIGAGTFTLLSDALGTGTIGEMPANASITGTFTVQRYLTGGTLAKRAWRLLSSPVNNNSKASITNNDATFNFASLRTNLFITGVNGNDNGFDQPAKYGANGPTIQTYNPATSKTEALTGLPNVAAIPVGQGFYFYFRGDNINNIDEKLLKKPQPTATNVNYAIPESVTALQTGTLNQGNLIYPLYAGTSGNGFNLVGNPYPSTINITTSNIAAAIPGTTGFIYIHNSAANSINPVTPDASNPIFIANGQGFFVKKSSSSSTASVVFTEALKTNTRPTTVLSTFKAPDPVITLKMAQDTSNFDITRLRFSDSYDKNYNEREDADDLNMYGQAVLFSAMTADNHTVGIASQPLNKQRTSVYLSIDAAESGDYSIQKVDLSAVPADYDVWLVDHFKKDSLDLRKGDNYQFSIDKKLATSYGNNRFEVSINKKTPPLYALLGFTGERVKSSTLLKWSTANEFTNITFEVQYSNDNKNFNTIKTVKSLGSGSYNITDASTSAGYYRLKQTDVDGNVKYSVVVIIPAYNTGLYVFSVYPNPTADVLQFKTNDQVKTTVALKIYNNTGSLLKSATFNVNTGQLNVASLIPGFYTVELYDNNAGKTIASTKFIKQ